VSDELLVNVMPGEIRAAVVSESALVELFIERDRRASMVGNICLGRVERVVPGMDAAFVDIGTGRSGFIGLDAARDGVGRAEAGGDRGRIADYLTEGEAITVQVVKDSIGGKGPQLARRITLPGRYLVYTPTQSRVAVSRQIEDENEQERLSDLMAGIAEPGEGFILRTASAGADADELEDDAEYLRELWIDIEAILDQASAPALLHGELDPLLRIFRDHVHDDMSAIRIDDRAGCNEARGFCARFMPHMEDRIEFHDGPEPVFELYDVEDEIARAREPRLGLPSGGGIVIESTEALTAIDTNSGSFTGASRLAETALYTNLEAAEEIARQIRLRNIGGLIIIDFIHLDDDDDWERVIVALEDALALDRNPSRVMGLTEAGLVEVTRRRRRESLDQALSEWCVPCAGTGRVSTGETVAHEVMRALRREARAGRPGTLAVGAAADVIDAMEDEAATAFEELSASLGRKILLRREPGYGRDHFDITVE